MANELEWTYMFESCLSKQHELIDYFNCFIARENLDEIEINRAIRDRNRRLEEYDEKVREIFIELRGEKKTH